MWKFLLIDDALAQVGEAADFILEFAGRGNVVEIVLLEIRPKPTEWQRHRPHYLKPAPESAGARLVRDRLCAADMHCEIRVMTGDVTECVTAYFEEDDCDLVVVPPRRQDGIAASILGLLGMRLADPLDAAVPRLPAPVAFVAAGKRRPRWQRGEHRDVP